jgi:hypothetical protein
MDTTDEKSLTQFAKNCLKLTGFSNELSLKQFEQAWISLNL